MDLDNIYQYNGFNKIVFNSNTFKYQKPKHEEC